MPSSAQPPEERHPPGSLRLTQIGGKLDRLLGTLAVDPLPVSAERALASLALWQRQVETLLEHRRISLEDLTPSSRTDFATICFLAQPGRLEQYLRAVGLARRACQAPATARRCPMPLLPVFRSLSATFRFRAARPGTLLSLPLPAIALDEAFFQSVAGWLFGKDPAMRGQVHRQTDSAAYQSLHKTLRQLAGDVGQPRGQVHDLGESFDRVNAAYFDSNMARPRLVWGAPTRRKMGHYQHSTDTVLISRSLDNPAVPRSTLDFLMYHELLHKKHGTHWKNNRAHVHTADFHQDERRYNGWQAAEAMLQRIAAGEL